MLQNTDNGSPLAQAKFFIGNIVFLILKFSLLLTLIITDRCKYYGSFTYLLHKRGPTSMQSFSGDSACNRILHSKLINLISEMNVVIGFCTD